MPVAVRLESASQRAEARIGSVINDKWTLDRLIGVGGMAAVYAATHRNMKRAAIKMLHAELSLDPVMRERFLREGYAANSVGQRGVVTVDDDDVAEDGCAFIVMELLDGETIDARWHRKNCQLSPQEVLSIGDQLLETLSAAHQKGVVHRDIKPENLFLTRDGVVKVLDFGIARLRELKGPKTSTQTGNTMGTPAFMAPEQARGKWETVDQRTDLWAVGATMYTLLTGAHVHEGETVNETLALAVTNPARSIKERRPDLHPALIELVDKALRYNKTERFPDAFAMQEALRRAYLAIQGEELSEAPLLSVPERSSEVPPLVLVPSTPSQLEKVDRSRQLTTARGVTASGQPTLVRSMLMRQRLLIGGAVLGAVLAFVLFMALGSSDPTELATASASGAAAATPPAVSVAKLSPPLASMSAEPRAVSLDELPQEEKTAAPPAKGTRAAPKPSGTKRTPSSKDPFARRR